MPDRPAKWFLRPPRPDSPARIFCFPFSGTGASSMRRWPARIGPLEVCPVQLPGRETRIRQAPYADFESFSTEAAEALLPFLDRPYLLFGHCMGALLAHALTVRLQEIAAPLPVRLYLSSARVPVLPPERRYRLPSPGCEGVHHPDMSDEELLAELQRVADTLGEQRMPFDLAPLAIRVLRSDMAMCFGYAPTAVSPVSCPITTISWLDDADVSPVEMRDWDSYGATTHHTLPGENVNFLTGPPALLEIIEREFEESAASPITVFQPAGSSEPWR